MTITTLYDFNEGLSEHDGDYEVAGLIAGVAEIHGYCPLEETVRITDELIEAARTVVDDLDEFDLAPLVSHIDGILHVEPATQELIAQYAE